MAIDWDAAIREAKAHEEANKPYYRPLVDDDGKLHICCLQPWDERDYHQWQFVTDETFPTEQAAQDWCIREGNLERIARISRLRRLGR